MLMNTGADEVGKRYALFYLLGCVASAFAGILAFGVSELTNTVRFMLIFFSSNNSTDVKASPAGVGFSSS